MRGTRRLLAVLVLSSAAVLVTGCTPVDRVAARLNSDGTLDFGVCDGRDVEKFETHWSADDGLSPSVTTDVDGEVEDGDVFRLGVPPRKSDDDYLSVSGLSGDRVKLSGYFAVEQLTVGEWAWNQTGIFVGTVDVDHCELADSIRVAD